MRVNTGRDNPRRIRNLPGRPRAFSTLDWNMIWMKETKTGNKTLCNMCEVSTHDECADSWLHVQNVGNWTKRNKNDIRNRSVTCDHLTNLVSCHLPISEDQISISITDFLLKIVAHDWDDFQKFLTSKLTPAKNVSHVKTALSIRSAKNLAGVPVDAEPTSD